MIIEGNDSLDSYIHGNNGNNSNIESNENPIVPAPTPAHHTEIIPPLCKPFVKWLGGKMQLLPQLLPLVPLKFERYLEPFLGAGALFFHLISEEKNRRFNDAFISDINAELINAYLTIKDSVGIVLDFLTEYQVEYSKAGSPEEYYYKLRDNYNNLMTFSHQEKDSSSSNSRIVERAAHLIALNKTTYNGMYRMNYKGRFNAPWGHYQNGFNFPEGKKYKKMPTALR